MPDSIAVEAAEAGDTLSGLSLGPSRSISLKRWGIAFFNAPRFHFGCAATAISSYHLTCFVHALDSKMVGIFTSVFGPHEMETDPRSKAVLRSIYGPQIWQGGLDVVLLKYASNAAWCSSQRRSMCQWVAISEVHASLDPHCHHVFQYNISMCRDPEVIGGLVGFWYTFKGAEGDVSKLETFRRALRCYQFPGASFHHLLTHCCPQMCQACRHSGTS